MNLSKVKGKVYLINLLKYFFEKKLNLAFVSLQNCVQWMFTAVMVVLSLRVLFTVVKCLHVPARAKFYAKCVWVFWQLRNTYMYTFCTYKSSLIYWYKYVIHKRILYHVGNIKEDWSSTLTCSYYSVLGSHILKAPAVECRLIALILTPLTSQSTSWSIISRH